tara:strand:- start:7475 stop:7720 length:246 start_codon:yes stop_codon:yes gene_type:complete
MQREGALRPPPGNAVISTVVEQRIVTGIAEDQIIVRAARKGIDNGCPVQSTHDRLALDLMFPSTNAPGVCRSSREFRANLP